MTVIAATVSAAPASASAPEANRAPLKQDVTQHRLTLVTGDVVTLTTRPGDDHPAISLDPTGPSRGTAEVTHTDEATYVVPVAANEAVTSNAVDLALFDVEGLVESGYDDAKSDSLPILLDNRAGRVEPNIPTTAKAGNRLESIHSLGARVPKREASAFWRANDTAACWSRAVPLGMDEIALEGQGLQVLKLLAAGLKDEAIARQLNTTTRTIRRRVQDVLTALHAKSRFHAGVEASRRGWV
jgi:DNA-binding CsgD family transcriptional regulator